MDQKDSRPGAQTLKSIEQALKSMAQALKSIEPGALCRYVCGAVAFLLSLLLFSFIFKAIQGQQERERAEIVVFGDSVMGEVRDRTAVPAQLETLLGTTVYNAAFGGSCAARLEQDKPLDYTKEVFSLVPLAKAVEADDFGVQQSVVMRESNTDYFAEKIDSLERLDFSKVRIFIIQQGINDYMAGVPIDNPGDSYDEHTFLGALRVAVGSLRKAAPGARIVFVTPLYTWYTVEKTTCEDKDCGGGRLEDYVDAQILLARELDVEIIDMYHDLFPHDAWEDWQLYSRDGLHPNEAGRERMALKIADYLGQ